MSEIDELPPPEAVRLYSIPSAADLLGGISERYVYLLIEQGYFRKVKQGKRTFVRDDDVAAYIAKHTA